MVSRPTRMTPPVECVRLFDAAAGLDGVIAIHSTALGPGAGGCRLWHYDDVDGALADALRLAEGMSYKNALAGLPFGGAKAVLRRPAGSFDRTALFRAFGRAVEALGGLYVTAEDVGTTVADLVARSFGDLDGLLAATVEDLEAVEGLGPVIAASVHDWLSEERNRDLLERLRTAGLHLEAADAAGDDVPQVLEGMAVVVTGTLAGMGRDDARAAITARGGTSPGSVSKKTTALVAGENAGSKLAKAADLGIPVLDEAAFEVLLATGQLPG